MMPFLSSYFTAHNKKLLFNRIDHSRNTITYHNVLCLSPQNLHKHCFQFPWGHFNSQEKLKTMLMQNFWVTNKEYYSILWYFLEWSIPYRLFPYKPRPRLMPHYFTKILEYGNAILEQEF